MKPNKKIYLEIGDIFIPKSRIYQGYQDIVYIQGKDYYNVLKSSPRNNVDHFPGASINLLGKIPLHLFPKYDKFLEKIPEELRDNIIKSLLSREKEIILFTLNIIESYG